MDIQSNHLPKARPKPLAASKNKKKGQMNEQKF